ncbi:MAG: prepilin peptidase [Planctomycetes bacterium]|nr:prepilin peptidase [Planctomycetota bacterium]MCB9905643.1 prepilin peptidase [Planctomycetota bacterium]
MIDAIVQSYRDLPLEVLAAITAVFGLFVGSFLNVVIYRYPLEDQTVNEPKRSACPSCGHQLGWTENIPLLSWLWQRGKCKSCSWRIPWRYPLVESMNGFLWGLCAWITLGGDGDVWLLLVRLLVISALVVTTFVDFDCFEIPDSVSIGGMVVGPMLSFLLPQLHVDSASALLFSGADEVTRTGALLNSLVGMASGFGVLWLVGRVGARAFGKDAMGFGDVKLLGAGGAFVGPGGILAALMLGSVLASLWGAAVMWRFYALVQGRARRRAGRKPVAKAWRVARLAGQYVPFGPFLAAGIGIVLLDWNHVLGLLFRT